jgi:hypothetical protein
MAVVGIFLLPIIAKFFVQIVKLALIIFVLELIATAILPVIFETLYLLYKFFSEDGF